MKGKDAVDSAHRVSDALGDYGRPAGQGSGQATALRVNWDPEDNITQLSVGRINPPQPNPVSHNNQAGAILKARTAAGACTSIKKYDDSRMAYPFISATLRATLYHHPTEPAREPRGPPHQGIWSLFGLLGCGRLAWRLWP